MIILEKFLTAEELDIERRKPEISKIVLKVIDNKKLNLFKCECYYKCTNLEHKQILGDIYKIKWMIKSKQIILPEERSESSLLIQQFDEFYIPFNKFRLLLDFQKKYSKCGINLLIPKRFKLLYKELLLNEHVIKHYKL